jgi:LDH2 family malate/lactate/ureidoglycolate dehydrogenase
MLVDMYIDRIRRGSVSIKETAALISERDAAVVLDAGHALGQLTGEQAMDVAIERAKRFGVAVAAVRHGFHFGAARHYAQQAAGAGCIGIAMCNTRPLMPAPGGAERLVGNNPLAIASPVDGPAPIVLDMATSEAAMGKIRLAAKAGEAIPANWAVASDGLPTTDAAQAIAGMLLPAGGAKGFGLAFVIDLICGLLSGGAVKRYGRSTGMLPFPTIARICSSQSMSHISGKSRTSEGRRRRQRTVFGQAGGQLE